MLAFINQYLEDLSAAVVLAWELVEKLWTESAGGGVHSLSTDNEVSIPTGSEQPMIGRALDCSRG
jgi:hypothetical protein